jgi:RimJ/RimL family protein N-acetyltransferase
MTDLSFMEFEDEGGRYHLVGDVPPHPTHTDDAAHRQYEPTERVSFAIRVCAPTDTVALQVLDLVEQEAQTTWIILFGGDRWQYVQLVAVALDGEGQPVGLASLAPTDEMGEGGPQIIGVWVRPSYRRRGIATRLVQVLAAQSTYCYGKPATLMGVTSAGAQLVQHVEAAGINLIARPVAGAAELP